ncbi:hypothetical protein [Microcoleus sp. B6-A1]|uniref:hypothetical protein n=1 Tax=Microcoleus sp. B6-A1 TaxID=2818684 RepID=UPI002FD019A6
MKCCPVLLLWRLDTILHYITQLISGANQMTASEQSSDRTLQEKHKELAEL